MRPGYEANGCVPRFVTEIAQTRRKPLMRYSTPPAPLPMLPMKVAAAAAATPKTARSAEIDVRLACARSMLSAARNSARRISASRFLSSR